MRGWSSRVDSLPRRRGMNSQRMHAAGEFARQRGVDHAVAFDPALPAKGFRHDIETEMGFAARPVSGVAFMAMGFVLYGEAVGREGLAQLFGDEIASRHSFKKPLSIIWQNPDPNLNWS